MFYFYYWNCLPFVSKNAFIFKARQFFSALYLTLAVKLNDAQSSSAVDGCGCSGLGVVEVVAAVWGGVANRS